MSGILKKRRVRRSVITLSEVDGRLEVQVAFHPTLTAKDPMPPHADAAMHALKSIAEWAKGGK